MRLRSAGLSAVIALSVCGPASAEDFTVTTTSGNEFSPGELTVAPGDSVTFTNSGGFHNVAWVQGTFDDGSQASPADPSFTWPSNPKRTFTAEGKFQYYCEQHGTASGGGMAGTVTVGTAGTPPADTTPPEISEVRAGVRRHRPFVRFTLSEPANVQARLLRRVPGPDKIHAEKNQDIEVEAARISFGKRKLKKGRYYVTLRATDEAGNESPSSKASFKVR
jgi:plastocyanin